MHDDSPRRSSTGGAEWSSEIEPAPHSIAHRLEFIRVTTSDGTGHRRSWNADELVGHHLRWHLEAGSGAGRQCDAKERRVDDL